MLSYQIKTPLKPIRADLIISQKLPDLSRSYIKRLAEAGKLSFNDQLVTAGYKLKQAGLLKLDYDPTALIAIPKIPLEIVYEDPELLVINKPAGVISHARGKFWQEASVASSVRSHLKDYPQQDLRAGLVHRLDRATSGLLIIAKDQASLAKLQTQFQAREVKKTYLAIVTSQPKLPKTGLIDKPIARNPSRPTTFKISRRGREAQTDFSQLKTYPNYTWLKLQPLTGRTHQLRVHLASLNWPIVGDQLYGGQAAVRLMLQATSLSFKQPKTGQMIKLKLSPPLEFETYQQ